MYKQNKTSQVRVEAKHSIQTKY